MGLLSLNIVIALVWLGLSNTRSGLSFFLGLVIGFVLIALFQPIFSNESRYSKRVIAFVRYLFIFIKALIISNIQILFNILFTPLSKIEPNLIKVDTSGLSQLEILLLTHSITLTPGTTTIDVENDGKSIVIHAFDGRHPDDVRTSIDTDIRAHILKFTR